ncbi:ABC transporter ATP-binding protein [Halosimplex litoreum]|uniref:ABC transporter ATP-binding protein n=1 Tax=Halosimplex litoreum TaxID=1198301 RepID=A0A7T3FZQ0_9EURY|nr:ABC transporter ATP-binding protein [Halosimplex litoreum]QPV63685.1 ABC transporter ATP-binding protein [Halosimplex litoreum]
MADRAASGERDRAGDGTRDPDREIRLDGVVRRYDGVTALAGVDLRIDSGDLHALVGPNGSGKSTLLALVLGLDRPTAGTITRPDGRIGCGFQTPSVYPDLTVDENLHVFAAMGDTDDDWLAEVRSGLELDEVRSRVAADLSGGYQRLLDVALAFVRRPGFVLLDEPLDELDDAARERVVGFVADYCEGDRTVVVSTHHLDAFGPSLDRLTVLADGVVRYDERVDGSDDYRAIYRDLVE